MAVAPLQLIRPSYRRMIYRVATGIMISECVAGGLLDLTRQAPFYPTMIHLGYPPYFTYILGAAKLLAAVALLVPGLPRLKEWAYSGIMINMLGAVASHFAKGDGFGDITPPAAFALIALLSWLLRQPHSSTRRSRRARRADSVDRTTNLTANIVEAASNRAPEPAGSTRGLRDHTAGTPDVARTHPR